MIAARQLPDRRLVLITVALLGLGLVVVFGASSYEASLSPNGTAFSMIGRHLVRVLLAVGVAVIAALIPYPVAGRLALVALPVSLLLLGMTLLGGSSVREAHGIGRWLTLFGVVVQPVELTKLSLALALPLWIERHPECTRTFRHGFLLLLAPVALAVLMLALQPNFGSALALGLVSLGIFWVAGVRARYLIVLVGIAALLCWIGFLHVDKLHERVLAWLGLLLEGDHRHSSYAYQSYQALVAIGSGGITGLGPGASTMKYLFLPEGHTDFIFAILGEELGLFGAGGLVVLLGLWLARAMKVAHRAADDLGYLMAMGVTCMIFGYALLNLAVVVGLMPVAGLPLPFLSYGGSALITNMAGVGVLLNISRHVRPRRQPAERWKGVRR